VEESWEYSHFLELLLSDEVERRDAKQLSHRLSRSGLSPEKTVESFDFSFATGVHKPTIRELSTCAFLEHHQNIFFVGPSGVGKSHLAQALGHEAARRGVDVLFRNTHELFWVDPCGARRRELRAEAADGEDGGAAHTR
jgi:DNA replication protein DnaC